MLAERVKAMEGGATTTAAKIEYGQQVESALSFGAGLEDDAIGANSQFLLGCRGKGDRTSMKPRESAIDAEQFHRDHFDDVDGHIGELAAAHFAQTAGGRPGPA